MSSFSRPPRARHRFGFRGKRAGRSTGIATTDQILDSLTRQARQMEDSERDRTLGLETISETAQLDELPTPIGIEPSRGLERSKTGNLGKFVFGLMFLGGLAFLSIYTRLSQALSVQNLAELQKIILMAGFADWQKVVLITLCALASALFARRSRRQIHPRSS